MGSERRPKRDKKGFFQGTGTGTLVVLSVMAIGIAPRAKLPPFADDARNGVPGRKTRLYLVDPQGGALTVKADGGPGGSGGRGGRGGQGGSGGMGTPSGSNGSNGSDGRSGSDGPPGRGGSITVTYDPQVKSYLAAIHLSNKGGPAPVFKEEPVAPLW